MALIATLEKHADQPHVRLRASLAISKKRGHGFRDKLPVRAALVSILGIGVNMKIKLRSYDLCIAQCPFYETSPIQSASYTSEYE